MTLAVLALICAAALLGPLLSLPRRWHIPVVIGELAVGIALGDTGVRLLTPTDPTFSFLAESVGFALVMFVAGSHVPIRSAGIRSGLRFGMLRAAGVGALSVPAGLALAELFGTGHGLLYAVLLSSSSAAIILPSLGDEPLTGPPILAMLAQVAVADATGIVLLPLALQPELAGARALGALGVLAAAYGVYRALRWAEASGRRRRVHKLSEKRGLALELRTSLTILFAMAALAHALGVSVMLAGFATGLAVAAVGEPRRVAHQLFAVTEGFFAPLFFVWLGAGLDVRQVLTAPGTALLGVSLGLAAALVHGMMAVTHQPLPIALTTCAQLGVPVAAATIGRAEGVLAPGEDAAIITGALVTIAVVTALNSRVARVARSSAPAPAPD